MLILSRKIQETVTLARDGETLATIRIVDISGNKVRLGIEADKSIVVDRSEVAEAKKRVG